MTNQEKIIGDLFRESLYNNTSIPVAMEYFSEKISKSFSAKDFLLLQMGSQLYESAQIRKKASQYVKMMSIISTHCYNIVDIKYPKLHFCTSQRFKDFRSELYKRFERIQDGLSPEIKDLFAVRVILLEDDTQEILKISYEIVQEIMESFSALNSDKNFPLYVNLSIPDKSVTKSDFKQSEHPTVLLPADEILISELGKLGKDYIRFPKEFGYQSFHISFELIAKSDPTLRIFCEIQIRTISQHKYAEFGPASHVKYKYNRNKKLGEIFLFEKDKVHIDGYYPNIKGKELDFSGFTVPTFVTEHSKTF